MSQTMRAMQADGQEVILPEVNDRQVIERLKASFARALAESEDQSAQYGALSEALVAENQGLKKQIADLQAEVERLMVLIENLPTVQEEVSPPRLSDDGN